MGSDGMGWPSVAGVDDGTVQYSMGGGGGGGGGEEESQQTEDDDDELAIKDAYLVSGGNRRRRRRNNRNPELLDGVVERSTTTKLSMEWIVMGVFVLFVIVLSIIVTAVVLLRKRRESSPDNNGSVDISQFPTINPSALSTQSPSVPPSDVVTVSPTASPAPTSVRFSLILDEVRRRFYSPTLEMDLQSTSSPQYTAALWMAEEDVSDVALGLEFPIDNSDNKTIQQFRQQYALVVFYYSTNGDGWLERCNFMVPTLHVCNWTCPWPGANDESNPRLAEYVWKGYNYLNSMGVECYETGYVIGLEMVFNNLSGYLSEELQGLDNIQTLNLESNNIRGTLPSTGFVSLFDLALAANQFSGSIPNEIAESTDLEQIFLEFNFLTGTIPPLSMDYLWLLDLTSNMLSGTIPPSLFQIQFMQRLDLADNILNGTIPNVMYLPSLVALSLDFNFISGTIPDALGNSTNLEFFGAHYNKLIGTILPSSVRQLTALRGLWLFDNQLTGEGLNWSVIGGMEDIISIDISNNHISGTIPTQIGELSRLNFLVIGHYKNYETRIFITGSLPTEIGQLQLLTRLGLNRNNFVGTPQSH